LWHLTYRETAVEAMPPGTGIAHIQDWLPTATFAPLIRFRRFSAAAACE